MQVTSFSSHVFKFLSETNSFPLRTAYFIIPVGWDCNDYTQCWPIWTSRCSTASFRCEHISSIDQHSEGPQLCFTNLHTSWHLQYKGLHPTPGFRRMQHGGWLFSCSGRLLRTGGFEQRKGSSGPVLEEGANRAEGNPSTAVSHRVGVKCGHSDQSMPPGRNKGSSTVLLVWHNNSMRRAMGQVWSSAEAC